MAVLDASAAVAAVTGLAGNEIAVRLTDEDDLVAPFVIDLEVMHAVRGSVRGGHFGLDRATDAIADFIGLDITRYPHEPFFGRIWELRDNLSAYDAAYLALAEATEDPLITRDAGLAAAAERTVDVEYFPLPA